MGFDTGAYGFHGAFGVEVEEIGSLLQLCLGHGAVGLGERKVHVGWG